MELKDFIKYTCKEFVDSGLLTKDKTKIEFDLSVCIVNNKIMVSYLDYSSSNRIKFFVEI